MSTYDQFLKLRKQKKIKSDKATKAADEKSRRLASEQDDLYNTLSLAIHPFNNKNIDGHKVTIKERVNKHDIHRGWYDYAKAIDLLVDNVPYVTFIIMQHYSTCSCECFCDCETTYSHSIGLEWDNKDKATPYFECTTQKDFEDGKFPEAMDDLFSHYNFRNL